MPDEFDRELRRVALALLDSAPPPPPFPSPAEPSVDRPWHRRRIVAGMTAVATIAAMALVAVGILIRGSTSDQSTVAAGQPVPTSTPAATPTTLPTTCGDQPPRPIAVPEGFAGPVAGPISAAPHPPEPGQLVMHWTSGAGGIELRWPLDPTVPNPFAPRPGTDGPVRSPATNSAGIFGAQSAAAGQTVRYMAVGTGIASPEACRALQLGVFDPDPARVQAVMEEFSRAPYVSDVPLVNASRSADAPPPVVLCNMPAGAAQTPNRSGEGDGVTYPNPSEALSAFLGGQRTLPPRGYLEFWLPDGTLAYGVQVREGMFVTVVQVVPSPAGGRVTRWEASGC
jgi:hypothetical protein